MKLCLKNLQSLILATTIMAYGCGDNGETNGNGGSAGYAGNGGEAGTGGQGGSSGGAGAGGSGLEVSVDCAQDNTYLNKMNCSAVVSNGDGLENCAWYRNDVLEDGQTDCNSAVFSNFDPGVANTYKIIVNSDVEDSMQKSGDYETPVIGICVTSGSPGDYIIAACARGPPNQPDGKDTYFVVVDHNLPPQAGNFYVCDQQTGQHCSENPSPGSTDMGSLYLTTKLCVDYNNTGDIESQEDNCHEKTINDF